MVISGPLTQGEIAAWAGLSREAVVKALHGLRTLGWVATTPRSITVVDVDAVTFRASLTIVLTRARCGGQACRARPGEQALGRSGTTRATAARRG